MKLIKTIIPATDRRISIVVCTLLWFILPASAWAAPQVLHGQVPAAVAGLKPVERLESSTTLHLAIGLPLRNQAALDQLLRDLYDPASPRFHQYLTPEQFTEQFGPTEPDYQTVIAFARANGLTVGGIHPSRMLVDVSGPAAAVERALRVTIHVYQHPRENRTFYAPDVEPSLDLPVPILSVSGLNNYSLPHPLAKAKRHALGMQAMPNSGSATNGGYLGKDFRAAYAPGVGLTGTGQSIALLEFDGYDTNDIVYYENVAGLPNIVLTNILLDGFNGRPGIGQDEVSLDIETAISMAPGLSRVIVYEAGPNGNWDDMLDRMANDNLAKQLSSSWGQYATNDPSANQSFQQMAAQGQSFFQASGDSDAYTGPIYFPSDNPYITQVGGTTLTTSGSGGAWQSETVWNWGFDPYSGQYLGSSGGISTQYPIPYWQTNVNMSANQGSRTMRNVPDVALTADNVYVRSAGFDDNFGGTSCAAPLWAGLTALINEQAAAGGKSPAGFLNPAIYAIGLGTNYARCFHDTTNGDNTWIGSTNRFFAVPGYDLCTGWGTPQGAALINALITPAATAPSILTQPQSQTVVGGYPVIFRVTAYGSQPLHFQWSLNGTNLTGANDELLFLASPQAAQAGTYSVLITNAYGSVRSSNAVLTVQALPPVLTVQPVSQTAQVGDTVTFNAAATGSLPLNYQWTFQGTNITGATGTTLILSNVVPAQAGAYAVQATNLYGKVTSSNAVLTVVVIPPTITSQPASQTVYAGDMVTFNVTAAGSPPLSYQWTFKGTNLVGATDTSITLVNVQASQAGAYAVQVTSPYGAVTSSNAVLTVQPRPPVITGQPLDQAALLGGAATFNVTAKGSAPLSYQWRRNGTNIAGATGSSVTLSNILTSQAGSYSVRVTNVYGSVISSNAALTVLPVPAFTNLHSFVGPTTANPSSDFVLSGSTLFGTTPGGGHNGYGAIFKISTNGTGKSTLHDFTGADGSSPNAVILSGGTLYGVTSAGGPYGMGTVFKVGTNGAGFTTLYNFTGNNDGAEPAGALVLSGRTLYGAAYGAGGANGGGTLFKVGTNGTGFTVFYTFSGGNDGANPSAGLILSGATLYGTASGGGANFNGTVFKVGTNGAGFTTVYTFSATWYNPFQSTATNNDGATPLAALVLSGNTLYGTTAAGGPAAVGTVFSVRTNGTSFTTLHGFTYAPLNDIGAYTNGDGAVPVSDLRLSGSTLYGTASQGGNQGSGTIFKLSTSGTGFTTLHAFSTLTTAQNILGLGINNDGAVPRAGLVLSGTTLYGTAANGGTNGAGTMFKLGTNGANFNLVHTFKLAIDGANPLAGLILSGGALYGTTVEGGLYGYGSVFKINTNGTGLSTLYSFTANGDGGFPQGNLILSGNTLYGTASAFDVYASSAGDAFYGAGTVFRINTDGTGFTNVYSFTGGADDATPQGGLVLSGDTLYGTTSGGALFGDGSVFSVKTNGSGFTTLHSFNYYDGSAPACGLVLSGGTLYGTAGWGGTAGDGTVFCLKTNGTGFTTLYNFTGVSDGGTPYAGLTLSGSTLYGTTTGLGLGNGGTVFSLKTDGTAFTTLHTFTWNDGLSPYAGLFLSGDLLYGVTTGGGNGGDSGGYGTIFMVKTNGVDFVALYNFGLVNDGSAPQANLVLSSNTLYGTAQFGGRPELGTVFALTLSPTVLSLAVPAAVPASSPVVLELPANISVIGPVQNTEVSWTPGLTLTRAITVANYTGTDDPQEIIVRRGSTHTRIPPQDLLRGSDVLLEPGDIVEIKSP